MSSKLNKITGLSLILVLINFLLPKAADACTYEATITGNHLDLKITSDQNYIQMVQFMHANDLPSAPYIVTSLEGPAPFPWIQYSDGYQTYSGYSMIIQNRRQTADAAYWVSWLDYTHYLNIPPGIYGLNFTGTMNYSDISVEYGTMDSNGNFGMGDAWHFCSRTGDISTPTPSPSPSPTIFPSPTSAPTPSTSPDPSPTPSPTQIPISKVILIPGFGASWNAEAFANCTFDNNPNKWSLAPYASDIYSPLIAAIKNSGWNLKEFYYDWKDIIQNNSNILTNVISSETGVDEKINLVGHSMGGLVAVDYLLGNPAKVNKTLTAGSPFKGSSLTYPSWEGGDIWSDNFITKIATTLFVKHCRNILNTTTDMETVKIAFPSMGNMLPTYNYLKDNKTDQIINPIYAINTWANSGFTLPSGLNVKTLSGNGYDTLSEISLKPANKREVGFNLWLDGKPASKIFSREGDGTVLGISSRLDGADNITMNQTHSGLVSSMEGMTEILKFLGTFHVQLSPLNSELKSSLIIIGYPSNFVITDQKGNRRISNNGMVSFNNPKSGSYRLNLLPLSNNTLFIVAQFLPNGDVKYKEYNIKGFAPNFKTLNFSLENPQEDILN